MAKFNLQPLNDREAKHYPKGSMELYRQNGTGQAQVWVVTPRDMTELVALLAEKGARKIED